MLRNLSFFFGKFRILSRSPITQVSHFRFSEKTSANNQTPNGENTSTELARRDNDERGMMFRRQKRQPDRFGISKMTKISQVIDLFQSPKFKLTLNENIAVLHRIGELCPKHQQSKIYCLEEILQKIEQGLRDTIDEDPMLGTFCFSLKTFTHYKNPDIWVTVKDLILMDCWDCEHDELFHAVQGFSGLENYLPEDWQVDLLRAVMQKVESHIILHIQQMKYDFRALKTISYILLNSERGLAEDLCEEIDFQLKKLLRNTTPDENCVIPASELIDMAYIFACADHFAGEFLEFTFKCVMRLIILEKTKAELKLDLSGNELGKFLHSWRYGMQQDLIIDLFDDNESGKLFREWAEANILKEKNTYLLRDLIHIHQVLDKLSEKSSQKLIRAFLQKKLLEINLQENRIDLKDIREYLDTRVESECGNDYKLLDDSVYNFLDKACEINIERFRAKNVLEKINVLEYHNILVKFPRFLRALPMYVSENASLYEFDDICYFYLILTVNSSFITTEGEFNDGSGKFWREMNIVRELIKTVSQARGFKIDLNSNFHKLLHVIDMTEFFQGGDMV